METEARTQAVASGWIMANLGPGPELAILYSCHQIPQHSSVNMAFK